MGSPAAGALERLSEEQRREYWACLALRHAPGLGARSCKKLLTAFGSAYAAVHKTGKWQQAGIPNRSAGIDSNAWRSSARLEWEAARNLDAEIVLWTDCRYPPRLRELPDAPVLLYARGALSLLPADSVAVVGMRRCSPEGRRAAAFLAEGLAGAGIAVVSGLAQGVDREAHRAALPLPGSSIAVLGTGLDVQYPAGNADLYAAMQHRGLLLSEFAPGTPPVAANFPVRNRIISGLSLGVVVVEAALRSGSLITARLALEQNRSVYAVPGAVDAPASAGCRELIRHGAQPVFDVADILADLKDLLRAGLPLRTTKQPDVMQTCSGRPGLGTETTETPFPERPGSPEARILAALSRTCPLDMDCLCRDLDLPVSTISVALLQLEMRRRVRRTAGNAYMLP